MKNDGKENRMSGHCSEKAQSARSVASFDRVRGPAGRGIAGLGLVVCGLAVFLAGASPARAESETLNTVKQRGYVSCGVTHGGLALAAMGGNGVWSGFYPEFCRAMASAIFDDPEAVDIIEISNSERFNALRRKEYDVLMEPATWTWDRDLAGLDFPALYLMDGQGFLTRKDSGIGSLDDLGGRRVCVEKETTGVEGLNNMAKRRGLEFETLSFATIEMAISAVIQGQCDVVTNDAVILAGNLAVLAPNPGDYHILPERISQEPLSPVVLDADPEWGTLVRWVVHATMIAEELEVTRENAAELRETAKDPILRHFLGAEENEAKLPGLSGDWAYNIVRHVGNYGQIYDRTILEKLGLERGVNKSWHEGGILWSPVYR